MAEAAVEAESVERSFESLQPCSAPRAPHARERVYGWIDAQEEGTGGEGRR